MDGEKKKALDANLKEAVHLLCVGVMFFGPFFLYFVFDLSQAAWFIKLGGAAVAVYSWFGCGFSMYAASRRRDYQDLYIALELRFERSSNIAQYFLRHDMDEYAIQAFVEDAVREKIAEDTNGWCLQEDQNV